MDKNNKALSFDSLVSIARGRFEQVQDPRIRLTEGSYSLPDVLCSGLAMFHFQDPSFLQFQKSLEDSERLSNLKTMFGVCNVPKTFQMKDLLDRVDPDEVIEVFSDFHREVNKSKLLQKFRFLSGRYLVPIDGSEYFSSNKLCCPHCLESKISGKSTDEKDKDEEVEKRYHHKILQAAIVKPGMKQVLPIGSEEVRKQDGQTKQDCELNAAKRFLPKLVKEHPHMDIVIIGDDLFSHVPFVELLAELKLSGILVAKPSSHESLYEDLAGLRRSGGVGRLEKVDLKGRKHIYEFCNGVVLRSDGKLTVNWFSYQLINESGEPGYTNSWITNLNVTARNVSDMVKAGRSRWKIENETFNTLKNQGYHIEHNYGHGQKHLSFVLFLLNLLAFFIHQILELKDKKLQQLYEKIGSRRELWTKIRVTVAMWVMDSWDFLMNFLLKRPFERSVVSARVLQSFCQVC